ncbi:phospholipase [Streptomyces sp. NBC_00201]|uniref:phospholipase n=1 Tax=unclassified Streptomyces TaxID=2593676 RepID=UPI00224EEB7B|nr:MULTISPECIES: phospholipase [unclassified Streptomyces]MCX5059789.1 phospholipase [Streptomyces sp. NBC_00452]MCX5252430.1 phospholipase [Streptomyces sp. NBC_00201]MCX5290701.1 phospholipase [Streptomyces sp. NBC_00183]
MRTPHALLATTAALAATVVAPPAHATAAVPSPGAYYLQSATTGLDAADNAGAVEQHRPKGDEDHQKWRLTPNGSSYVLESTDTAGSCLGRLGDQARTLACASADAAWEITPSGADQYTLKAPGAERYLTVAAKLSGGNYPAQLTIGTAGGLAAWYLTPVTPTTAPMPPQDQRTLDQVTFLTAHNAYANGVDGGFAPPFVNFFPNQARGIDRQLTDGVRGFMLDIHQTPDGAILCHDSCTLVSRPVALWVDLQRMVDFLKAHPDQFVTVFLEDYVDPGVLRSELARVNGLSDVLYRPDRTGVRQSGWPKLSDLIAANQRLLIFTDHSRSADESAGLTRDSFGVMYQREWTVENYWSMGSGIGSSDWSCYSRWYAADTNVPLTRTESGFRPLFVMNHFRDAAVAATATTDNTKLTDRARRFCQPAARKKPNFLAVDRYDLGDPAAAVNTLSTYTYP